jgi:hypothetical protein
MCKCEIKAPNTFIITITSVTKTPMIDAIDTIVSLAATASDLHMQMRNAFSCRSMIERKLSFSIEARYGQIMRSDVALEIPRRPVLLSFCL